MAAFVPPFFGNFGKKVKDLFSKQYEYDNKLTTKNKTRTGLTVESTATFGSDLTGAVDATYTDKSFGETKFAFNTVGKAVNTTKLTKLQDGLTLTVENGVEPKNAKGPLPTTKVVAEYSVNNAAAAVTANYTHPDSFYNIETAVSAGSDGVSVGASAKFVKDAKTNGVADYNVGVEYTDKDYTVTVKTEKVLDTVKIGFIHKVDSDLTVGADASVARSNGDRTLTFGSEYALDKTTTIKSHLKNENKTGKDGKTSSTTDFAVAYTQKFENPKVQLAYAAQFGYATGFAATKFGVAATFGDF